MAKRYTYADLASMRGAQSRGGTTPERDRWLATIDALQAQLDAMTPRKPEYAGDLHWRLTEIVDSAFGPISTAPVEKLLTLLEQRAEEMRVERVRDQEQ